MSDPRQTYEPTAQEVTLREWVRLVVSSWDTYKHTVEVVYANDRGPRPVLPYVSIQVIAERDNGWPARHTSDTVGPGGDYEAYAQTHYVGTVSINVYGSIHRAVVRALVGSIERDDVQELTTNDQVYLQDVPNQILDMPTERDTKFEPRSQVDVRFAFADRVEFEAEAIETISGTVELEAGDGTTITSPFEAP